MARCFKALCIASRPYCMLHAAFAALFNLLLLRYECQLHACVYSHIHTCTFLCAFVWVHIYNRQSSVKLLNNLINFVNHEIAALHARMHFEIFLSFSLSHAAVATRYNMGVGAWTRLWNGGWYSRTEQQKHNDIWQAMRKLNLANNKQQLTSIKIELAF